MTHTPQHNFLHSAPTEDTASHSSTPQLIPKSSRLCDAPAFCTTIGFIGGAREMRSRSTSGNSAVCSRPKARTARYHPMVAQIKKDEGPSRNERLAGTLTELVFDSVYIIEQLNPTVTIMLENKYGLELVSREHSLLQAKLRPWIPENFDLFLSCATEFGWVLDNYNCLGAENKALSSDTMNGFFIGQRSAAQLIDHLFACVGFTNPDTEAGRDSRSQLLITSTALHFERQDRLVGQLKRARNFLSDATVVLRKLDKGVHNLEKILEGFLAPSLEKACREALLITAAARMGIDLIGEEQLLDFAHLIDQEHGDMSGTKMICPAIVSRRLWDCLLPYVGVDKYGRTMRGTADQMDWLVTESYSGVAAGLSRLYGSRASIYDVATPVGVVREGHRPTVHNMEPSEMTTLQWLIWSPESPVDHAYYEWRDIARSGRGPRSRASAHIWLKLYNQVRSVDPDFAERHCMESVSLALRAVSLLAAAAETPVDFREGLLMRIVATFSCEDCRIELPCKDCLVVGRNGEGNVTLSSTGTRVDELLTVIAARIDRHCTDRGTKVTSDLRYTPVKRTVPDFVQSMSVETSTPAVWVNLVDINGPLEPFSSE